MLYGQSTRVHYDVNAPECTYSHETSSDSRSYGANKFIIIVSQIDRMMHKWTSLDAETDWRIIESSWTTAGGIRFV